MGLPGNDICGITRVKEGQTTANIARLSLADDSETGAMG